MAKMKSIHEDTNNKVNAILNDEQKQKYADMQEKMRQRMQNRMQSRGSQNQ
jgi:Spy/CpxP family protein refolding chaperone